MVLIKLLNHNNSKLLQIFFIYKIHFLLLLINQLHLKLVFIINLVIILFIIIILIINILMVLYQIF